MAITSNVSVAVAFTVDFVYSQSFASAENTAASGVVESKTLASGLNTITPPAGGTTPVQVLIIPPSGNTATLTLKGVTGDTGVVLHKTNPTLIGLNSPTTTFVLTCSAIITGVRFVWG